MTVKFAEEPAPNEGPKQPHLAKQDAASVDPSQLTALTPEVVRAYVRVGLLACCALHSGYV